MFLEGAKVTSIRSEGGKLHIELVIESDAIESLHRAWSEVPAEASSSADRLRALLLSVLEGYRLLRGYPSSGNSIMNKPIILAEQLLGLIRKSGASAVEASAALSIATIALAAEDDALLRSDLPEAQGQLDA